ncbi:MAG: hypothetical protein RLZZ165_2186 [Bacteroidota bacterium]
MKNIIAIRREDLDKKGEQRVPVTPALVRELVASGHPVLVQPGMHPVTREVKRAHADLLFEQAGASIQEDIREARIILGLKEIALEAIFPGKVYCCFSHTHKGQLKNRQLLQTFVEKDATLIDYELITNAGGERTLTAFTYYAGYAGMIDTLWAYGQRQQLQGKAHPFTVVPQAIAHGNLAATKRLLRELREVIEREVLPADEPPFINLVMGNGKTSKGAQEIFGLLPVKRILPQEMEKTYRSGSRNCLYECVMGIGDMFRPKEGTPVTPDAWASMDPAAREAAYMAYPEDFESNLAPYLPYATIAMNCITWSPRYPRTVTKDILRRAWEFRPTLQVIGDISCDPNGAVEFSRDTWIDDPVFLYHPLLETSTPGMAGDGVAVMAVTNLPCEFSLDSSEQFAMDLEPLLHSLVAADFDGSLEGSGLDDALKRGVILWRGNFPRPFEYMRDYISASVENGRVRV